MILSSFVKMSLRRSTRVSTKIATPAASPVADSALSHKRKASNSTPANSKAKKSRPAANKTENPAANGTGDSVVNESSEAAEASPFKKPAAPATPARARSKATKKIPPLTPTPSLVKIIRAPYSSGDIDDSSPPPVDLDRPVGIHTTNAPLATPGGSRRTAYTNSNGIPESSPSKTGLPRPTATTGTLLEQAQAHLIKVDPRMKPLVEKFRCTVFSPEGLAETIDPFRSLASGICGQQVSGAAAKSIKNKFVALFNEDHNGPHIWPTVHQVAATSVERLKTAGLSTRKAEYIQGLAQKFVDGELTTEMLMKASDEEVMEKLIAVRGLGKWSVEMFACFGLKRMDILSTGDLGVQRGMAAHFGRDIAKLKAKGGKWKYMSEQDMLDKSAIYAPYRSLFMWYMWRVEDVDVAVMENN